MNALAATSRASVVALSLTAACASDSNDHERTRDAGREVSQSTDSAVEDGSADAVNDAELNEAPTYAPTFTAIWNEILVPTCASPFCHLGDATYLRLQSQQGGYESLREQAQGPDCAGTHLLRVSPGNPDASLFYLKLQPTPPCGAHMPNIPGVQLSAEQLEQVRRWIELGAPND